ncbi:MAG TPA: AIR synthase related protein [Acidimicrobiales bacterium]|nr:AIR synthase related protein [Acidimicrobiales bacterium]
MARLAQRFPAVGDDAAVLPGGLLASTDTLVEGVDWRPEWSSAGDVGWKAIMVNASDIAAMGGRSTAFLVSLVVAAGFDVEGFFDGVQEACDVVGAPVVGGDLSGGPVTVVTVTVLGHTDQPILRSGARVGDGVYVSGEVGAAARDLRAGGHGLAHRRPSAYLGLRPEGATALIDVSDGLITDCGRIAAASGVCLALDDVPVADGASLDDALHGGEDFVLVACSPVPIEGWTRIGAVVPGSGVTLHGDAIAGRGWEHQL